MTMLFGFGGKKTTEEYQINQGSANKGTYIPDGISKEQYAKVLAEEAKKADAKKKKFPKGKETESLTEWMAKEEKKGLSGKDLNIKGHRMVKAKYPEFYTDEQSGVSW
jgi:ssDNA-binding replication factor A large subunit